MIGEVFTKYVTYRTGILSINGQMNGTNIFFFRILTKGIASWKAFSRVITKRQKQIKTILICHHNQVRVAVIQKTNNNKCQQGGGEGGTLTLLSACEPEKPL